FSRSSGERALCSWAATTVLNTIKKGKYNFITLQLMEKSKQAGCTFFRMRPARRFWIQLRFWLPTRLVSAAPQFLSLVVSNDVSVFRVYLQIPFHTPRNIT